MFQEIICTGKTLFRINLIDLNENTLRTSEDPIENIGNYVPYHCNLRKLALISLYLHFEQTSPVIPTRRFEF